VQCDELKPPIVAPVVLGLNYHAQTYQHTNSTILRGIFGNQWAFINVFGQISTAYAHKLLFLSFQSDFWHCSWIRRPDVLKESSNLAIKRHFMCLCFTIQIENMPYFYFRFIWPNDLEHASHVSFRIKISFFYQVSSRRPIRSWLIAFLLLIRYVTLWSWSLTLWPWTVVVCRLSRDQNQYMYVSYDDLTICNSGAVRHVDFDQQ